MADEVTLADYLRAVAPQLPPALVSAGALSELEGIAAALPADLTSLFVLGCRLGGAASGVDLLALVTRDRGREALARARWGPVRAFGERWASPASPLFAGADDVWLEFDVGDTRGVERSPGLSFRPLLEPAEALVEDAWRALLSQEPPVPARRALRECVRALPPGARVSRLGFRLSRESDRVRLCVNGVAADEVGGTLAALGWPGSRERVAEVLALLAPHVDDVTFAIEVGDRVEQELAVEGYLGRFHQPAEDPRWEALLSALVERGLASPGKRDALLTCSGISSESEAGGLWPRDLTAASALRRHRFTSVFQRAVHHLALSVTGERLEARGYLALVHKWAG